MTEKELICSTLLKNIVILMNENNETSVNSFTKKANINVSAVTNLKRNRIPSIDIIYKIAKYFNVSIDYLMGRTNIKEVNTGQKTHL